MVQVTFNALEYEPVAVGSGNYLGVGTFLVQITDVDLINREIGGEMGQEFVFTVECVDSEDKDDIGKLARIQALWEHPSKEAWVKAGRNRIAAITAVVAAPTYWTDTNVLCNIPFLVTFEKNKKDEKYTVLTGIFDAQGNDPQFKQAAPKAPPKAAPTKAPAKPAPAPNPVEVETVEMPEEAPATPASTGKPGWATKFKKA